MLKLILVILITGLGRQLIENNHQSELLVLNVGQGSWSIYNDGQSCFHFDQGGEWASLKLLKQFCLQRSHILFISHTDKDHINFIRPFAQQNKLLCLAQLPGPQPIKVIKQLKKHTLCKDQFPFQILKPQKTKKNSNSFSSAIFWPNKIFFTGDSPKSSERDLISKISKTSLRIYIAGHHGSKTSTSIALLEKINPKQTIISARQKKYGHPHLSTLSLLRKKRVPTLTTEKWGSILIKF